MKPAAIKFSFRKGFFGLIASIVLVCVYAFAQAPKEEHDHNHDHEHEESQKPTKPTSEEKSKDAHEHHDDHDEHGHNKEKAGHKGEHEKGHEHGEEEGEEEASGSVGPGKAVEAVDQHSKRFKLSEKALSIIGVKTSAIRRQGSQVLVPKSAVVEFGAEFGVYVERDGWFKLEEVKIVSRNGNDWSVSGGGLSGAMQIVTEGVALLRVAELDAFGGGGHGHSH